MFDAAEKDNLSLKHRHRQIRYVSLIGCETKLGDSVSAFREENFNMLVRQSHGFVFMNEVSPLRFSVPCFGPHRATHEDQSFPHKTTASR